MREREFHDEIGSTQSRAEALARAGAPVGTIVVAARQTEGRGRGAHTWVSPPGNLHFSYIGPAAGPGRPALSVWVGAGLQELLSRRWALPVQLKWPNDLVVDGPGGAPRKLGGVLPEQVHGTDGYRTVIGLGLNVSARLDSLPAELRSRIVRWEDLRSPPPPLEEIEAACVARIEEVISDVATPRGRERWWMQARTFLYGRGRPVRVDGRSVGLLRDVTEEGALRVEGPSGSEDLLTGEVRWEDAP
jgi:BirA family biotin operon repressor/biotin-[acetyl-CoA-carboxylase] ligase